MAFNYLSLLMGLAYIALGIFVIIYKFFVVMLEPNIAYALGAVLIGYGGFRMYRSIVKLKNRNEKQ